MWLHKQRSEEFERCSNMLALVLAVASIPTSRPLGSCISTGLTPHDRVWCIRVRFERLRGPACITTRTAFLVGVVMVLFDYDVRRRANSKTESYILRMLGPIHVPFRSSK